MATIFVNLNQNGKEIFTSEENVSSENLVIHLRTVQEGVNNFLTSLITSNHTQPHSEDENGEESDNDYDLAEPENKIPKINTQC